MQYAHNTCVLFYLLPFHRVSARVEERSESVSLLRNQKIVWWREGSGKEYC